MRLILAIPRSWQGHCNANAINDVQTGELAGDPLFPPCGKDRSTDDIISWLFYITITQS